MLFSSFHFATRRFGAGHQSYINPLQTANTIQVGLSARGKIGSSWIFQRSHGGYQRKRYFIPADPKTPAQLARRSKFADAVAWALALDGADKQFYLDKVRNQSRLAGYPLSPYSGRSWLNFAISDYMRTN